MEQYIVTGMSCAACQARVEKAVSRVPGVTDVVVSLLTNSMTVKGDVDSSEIIKAVKDAGYGIHKKSNGSGEKGAGASISAEEEALKDTETPKLKKRLFRSVLVLIVLMYFSMGHNMLKLPVFPFLEENYTGLGILQMLLALTVMYINKDFFVSGFRALFRGSPNMDSLVALGSGVSFGWSVFVLFKMTWMIAAAYPDSEVMQIYHNRLYFESAAMIPALITIGKTLESVSKGRTTDALKNLLKMAPKTAVIERDGIQEKIGIDEVAEGDIFVVKPGESIPVDGIITEGSTAVDESVLTGESVPSDKSEGDMVSAATINKSGFIKARALRVGEDTVFSQIIKMVSDAAATKAPIARIADKVSGIFVPVVMIIAAAVLISWLLRGAAVPYALEHAVTVLVISCPCALGLATPVAIMAGNGAAAKSGILFKTGEALENTGRIKAVALDKTGTLTEGRPYVTDIYPMNGFSERDLLEMAYSLEVKSEHPLAQAIVERGKKDYIRAQEIKDFRAVPQGGLAARMDGYIIHGGSLDFISRFTEISDEIRDTASGIAGLGKTPLFFEIDRILIGIIAVADVIKKDSPQAVRELREMGIEVVMLTGDNERTASVIAKKAGVDRVIAGVLPEGKESVIRELQKNGKTAMVGDGINDAPALARADIGIAIGAGTDIAIDSADIVLMNSRLTDVSGAIRLSRAVLRIIHQNLFWAFAYNAILIPMAAGVFPGIEMNPMWGAAAMSLSSVTVCLNALRLNLFKIKKSEKVISENNKNTPKENTIMKETVKINGMMCPHCEASVKKALENIDGIEKAEVSHEKGTAVLTLNREVDEALIRAAVTEKDFEFVSMEK